MNGKGLPVIEERVLSHKEQFEVETRNRCEATWAKKPLFSILDQERIRRSTAMLSTLPLKGKAIADLGSGASPYPLKDSMVTAVDASQKALDQCPDHVKCIRGCLPYVRLPEESFDGVLLLDVITELEPHLYRLLLSEASLLMKREAFCLCSCPLDFDSEDPLGHFLSLLRTEFDIVELKKSYHRLYIILRRLLDAPGKFICAAREEAYRRGQIEKRRGLLRLWFYLNSMKAVSYFWKLFAPLKRRLHNRTLLLALEKLSEILWGDGALSHVIVLCKRKSWHKR